MVSRVHVLKLTSNKALVALSKAAKIDRSMALVAALAVGVAVLAGGAFLVGYERGTQYMPLCTAEQSSVKHYHFDNGGKKLPMLSDRFSK